MNRERETHRAQGASEKYDQFVSAVVYVCDDGQAISRFSRELCDALSELFKRWEIVFVDDCSSDGTVDAIRDGVQGGGVVSIVSLGIRSGRDEALFDGIHASIGDMVFTFEGAVTDLSARDLDLAFTRSLEGYDVVSARASGNKTALGTRLFYAAFNRWSLSPARLGSEPFSLMSRRAINRIEQLWRRPVFLRAAASSCGLAYSTVELPRKRTVQRRSWRFDRWRRGAEALFCYTEAPFRLSLGVSAAAFALALATFVAGMALGFGEYGWLALIGAALLLMSALFVASAGIMRYCSLILQNMQRGTGGSVRDCRRL